MIKKINMTFVIASMSLFLALHNISVIAQSGDAFAGMQYNQVFDQTAIYKKYRKLMYKLGCADNVFASQKDENFITKKLGSSFDESAYIDKHTILPFDPVVDGKELAAFEKECMDQLNNARRMILLIPTTRDLTNLAFTAALGTSLVIARPYIFNFTSWISSLISESKLNKPQENQIIDENKLNNLHNSQSIDDMFFSTVLKAGLAITGIVGAGYNLMYWPDNSLESLENHFAKNKCYIPRALWPKITQEFIGARQDAYNREHYTNFLSFALGFTVYKPKKPLQFKDDMSVEDVKKELNKRIDGFFDQYKDNPEINYIKINVSKFIDTLANDSQSEVVQGPRYIYLYGSGGIGKTHFVQTLSDWISELAPESVMFADVVINSSDDLEGSEARPGAFLKALRNQLIENKRGSVIIMDEATWLNSGAMVSSAKRIFNGDRSKLVTSYFGSNMDGSGVSLQIPPMLIFVASNEDIADPALKSRFDMVFYPTPSLQALVLHAINVAEKSSVLKQENCPVNKDLIARWIQNLDEKYRNFRFVAGNVEALLLTYKP